MAGEKVCDIEVSLQSVPSLDGLAHFDEQTAICSLASERST